MFKNLSIRLRLTMLSIFMLTLCCVGLTIVLNVSAFQYFEASAPTTQTRITEIAQTYEIEEEGIQAIPLQAATEAKKGFGMESMLYMFLFVVCGGALTYAIVEKSLKPLHNLHEQVKNRSVNNLSEHIEIPMGKDEITDLTISFNDMSDKLHNAFMMQQRFSASAAHELRTPLAVLQTKIDVFKKKSACDTEDYEALIHVFEVQTLRLRALIKNLLALNTSVEAMEVGKVCLQDVVEGICMDLSGIAKDKEIEMLQQLQDCYVIGNIDLLYRALYNIIENSINYTSRGGFVSITIHNCDRNQVEISICDNGIGIQDEEKKHVFEPFYQVHKDSVRGSVGLGLAIVDAIIKKHQGTIEIFDTKDGGTGFKILLPSIQ